VMTRQRIGLEMHEGDPKMKTMFDNLIIKFLPRTVNNFLYKVGLKI